MDRLLKIRIKGDGIIWMVFFFLCIISIVEVFSASSTLTYKGGTYFGPVIRHTLLLLIGVCCMIGVMNIKCKYFKIVTPFALILSFILLVTVLFVGESTNGAQRWISLLGFQFQPSELAKGALILAEAQILSAMQTEDGADRRAFKYIAWLSLPYILLIGKDNLSTAALLCVTIFIMMFIGRVPRNLLGRTMGLVVLAAGLGLGAVMLIGEDKKSDVETNDKMSLVENDANAKKDGKKGSVAITNRFTTWKNRIQDFMPGEDIAPNKVDLEGRGAQKNHASIAIATSNVVGKGPGNSVERDFLSQAYSDFIYAIIIEELGIAGAVFVCLLYIILLFRTAAIANHCVNTFPALLIMGIALLLAIQAFFNMMVAVGLAPVTGQPLPLVSRGGTSSIMNCIYIGIILSVSYTAKKRDDMDKKKKGNVALAAA